MNENKKLIELQNRLKHIQKYRYISETCLKYTILGSCLYFLCSGEGFDMVRKIVEIIVKFEVQ